MAQEGIHYVVGPNVDDGAAAVRPVAEKAGIIYFPYAFPKALYTKPASNAVLGMVASYQSGPGDLQVSQGQEGREDGRVRRRQRIRSAEPARQRRRRRQGARPRRRRRQPTPTPNDTRDFTPVLTPIVKLKPDLLVLSGVAPANAPLLIRSARELGYKGLISTETAQDAKVLEEGAGDLANGFISVGGASTPEIRSKAMEEFIDRYTKKFGEYNDEFEHQGLRARVHRRHAEGEPEGDRQRRRVQEDDRRLLRARTPTSRTPRRRCTTSATPRSARSASSPCRWSSTNTRTASSRRCSSPTSTDAMSPPPLWGRDREGGRAPRRTLDAARRRALPPTVRATPYPCQPPTRGAGVPSARDSGGHDVS